MDELDEISLRMSVSNLEAKLALVDLDMAALEREINSRLTTQKRIIEARISLNALRDKRANLRSELIQLSRAHPDIRH